MKKILPLAVTAAAVAYYAYYKLVEANNNCSKEKNNVSNVDFKVDDEKMKDVNIETSFVDKENIDLEIQEKPVFIDAEEIPETVVQHVTLNEIEVKPIEIEINETSFEQTENIETVVQPVTLNEIVVEPGYIEEDNCKTNDKVVLPNVEENINPETLSTVENVEENEATIELQQFEIEEKQTDDAFDPDPVIETVLEPETIEDDYIPKSEAEAFVTNFEPEINRFRTVEKESIKEKLTVSVAASEEINQKEVEELIERIRPVDVNESIETIEIEETKEETSYPSNSFEPEIDLTNFETIIDSNNIESIEEIENENLVLEPKIEFSSIGEEIENAIKEIQTDSAKDIQIDNVNEIEKDFVNEIQIDDISDFKTEDISNIHIENIDVEEQLNKLTSLQFNKDNEEEMVDASSFLKEEEKIDQQRKILELQIDLQLADFDEGKFVVKQKVTYNDEKLFDSLIDDIKNYDYYVDENSSFEKLIVRKVNSKEKAKSCILSIYDRVKDDNQMYEYFKVKVAR